MQDWATRRDRQDRLARRNHLRRRHRRDLNRVPRCDKGCSAPARSRARADRPDRSHPADPEPAPATAVRPDHSHLAGLGPAPATAVPQVRDHPAGLVRDPATARHRDRNCPAARVRIPAMPDRRDRTCPVPAGQTRIQPVGRSAQGRIQDRDQIQAHSTAVGPHHCALPAEPDASPRVRGRTPAAVPAADTTPACLVLASPGCRRPHARSGPVARASRHAARWAAVRAAQCDTGSATDQPRRPRWIPAAPGRAWLIAVPDERRQRRGARWPRWPRPARTCADLYVLQPRLRRPPALIMGRGPPETCQYRQDQHLRNRCLATSRITSPEVAGEITGHELRSPRHYQASWLAACPG